MEYKPHDYQQFAINYILEHPIAAVILGMGLGKTSITLTAKQIGRPTFRNQCGD